MLIRNLLLACGIPQMKNETSYLRFLACARNDSRMLSIKGGSMAASPPYSLPKTRRIVVISSAARNLIKMYVFFNQLFIAIQEKYRVRALTKGICI